MPREFKYRGKTLDELSKMGITELSDLFGARTRRKIKKGFTKEQKALLEKIKKAREGKYNKLLKTHCRDMPFLHEMIGLKIEVHNGKAFVPFQIQPEELGHLLGEFALTRREVKHKAPGVGATRSSKHISVK